MTEHKVCWYMKLLPKCLAIDTDKEGLFDRSLAWLFQTVANCPPFSLYNELVLLLSLSILHVLHTSTEMCHYQNEMNDGEIINRPCRLWCYNACACKKSATKSKWGLSSSPTKPPGFLGIWWKCFQCLLVGLRHEIRGFSLSTPIKCPSTKQWK